MKDPPLTALTRAAFDAIPVRLRRLAAEARVSYSTLSRIQRGKLKASPGVARAVARVLRRWGRRCSGAGEQILAARRRPS